MRSAEGADACSRVLDGLSKRRERPRGGSACQRARRQEACDEPVCHAPYPSLFDSRRCMRARQRLAPGPREPFQRARTWPPGDEPSNISSTASPTWRCVGAEEPPMTSQAAARLFSHAGAPATWRRPSGESARVSRGSSGLDFDQHRAHRRITGAFFDVRDAGSIRLEHPGLGGNQPSGAVSLRDDPIALRVGDPDEVIAVRVKRVLLFEPRDIPDGDRVVFEELRRAGSGERRRQLRGLRRRALPSAPPDFSDSHRPLRCCCAI